MWKTDDDDDDNLKNVFPAARFMPFPLTRVLVVFQTK
jgi:hypothetical protein